MLITFLEVVRGAAADGAFLGVKLEFKLFKFKVAILLLLTIVGVVIRGRISPGGIVGC